MRPFRWIVMGLASALLLGAAPTSQSASDSLQKARLQVSQEELFRAEQHLKDVDDAVAATRSELRQRTGLVDVSPQALGQAITRLQDEQEQLELEDAGAQGRRAGLSDAISKLTEQIKQKADSDAAVDELKQVLALYEKELQRLQQSAQAHAVSQQAVDDAQAKVADARLKLIEARRQAVGTTAAESLEIWNRELMNLSIAQRERDARLKFIQNRLQRLSQAVPDIDRLESLTSQQQFSRQALRDAQSRYEMIRSEVSGDSARP